MAYDDVLNSTPLPVMPKRAFQIKGARRRVWLKNCLPAVFSPFIWVLAFLTPWNVRAAESAPRIELTAEERAWIADHSPVRVGITPDWAPFSYEDDAGICVGI